MLVYTLVSLQSTQSLTIAAWESHFNVSGIYLFVKNLVVFSFTLVPPPTYVTVTNDPISTIKPFVSPNVTLSCTVELSPAVDVPVTVNTEWTGPHGFMTRNVAHLVMGKTTTYISALVISSFVRNPSGNYTCSAILSSTSQFLSDSLPESDIKTITTGKIPIEAIVSKYVGKTHHSNVVFD